MTHGTQGTPDTVPSTATSPSPGIPPTATSPSSGSDTAPPPDPRRRLAFAVVLVAGFMDLVDSTVVNVTAPSVQQDLHARYVQIEWIVAAYVLSFAALLILSGQLGDIYGRKRVFTVGMAGFTLTSLCCGLSTGPGMLIAARLAQGAFAGLMVTQILAILRVTFPPAERAKAVGVFGAVTGSSAVLGLALGGVIVQWDLFGLHWRPIFLVNVPVGVAALIAGGIVIRESRAPRVPELDVPGMLLALTAVTLLVYPLTEGRSLGWPAWTLAMMAGAAVLLAVFVGYERRRFARVGSALVDFAVFRSRAFSVGMGMWWLFWTVSGGFFFTWTLFLQQGLGWTPLHAGLAAATFAVGVGTGAGNAPAKLVPRLGRTVLVLGALVNAAGFLAFGWLVWHYGTGLATWQIAAVQVVAGAGFGMVIAPTLDLLLGQVGSGDAGAASGMLNTVQQLGITFGVALSGVLFFGRLHGGTDGTGGTGDFPAAFSLVLLVAGGILLVVGLGFLALPGRRKEQAYVYGPRP
ncbi:MFS transporter [Actinacidiphila paucisporea]|uniref:MFS transporter n=1 Tax=Actinacidiphila paucisporea TaxID=310782 RepID=UPI001F490955|nr:MFS transporter [Actinacidiphila paucisporea]